jgi:hypothetical protein
LTRDQNKSDSSSFSNLVSAIINDRLTIRPAPPGDRTESGKTGLKLKPYTVNVDASRSEIEIMKQSLSAGILDPALATAAIENTDVPRELASSFIHMINHAPRSSNWESELTKCHQLDQLALVATTIVDRALKALLDIEPLQEIHFAFSNESKIALAIAWQAMVERGIFPLPPLGARRYQDLQSKPSGAMHFVSASDLDAGYFYTMGIALSPEAQALQTMDVTYGLDGELIVPGQAVSPIPPYLSMATRLFAASIPTSSNISEEVHSIPQRKFPHPSYVMDLEPYRGGLASSAAKPRNIDEAITELKVELNRYEGERMKKGEEELRQDEQDDNSMPKVGAVFDVSGMTSREITYWMEGIFVDVDLRKKNTLIALYLNVENIHADRVGKICSIVDVAAKYGLRYVAITDDTEDPMLPDLLEYLTPNELNDLADYADSKAVIVIDGRPIDPIYTAATAAQRIQSVYSTLSVDILKMGMWLCLDALSARRIWKEILSNPHIPHNMLLMPIGIVEPWNAFVDNRDPNRNPRAIIDPFEKIKFMIEEAKELGIPSLLTDTRHKEKWVLLGRKTPDDEPHPREQLVKDAQSDVILGRTTNSALPLLSWKELMKCERLARKAGVLLGQAGSIERDQVFRIISETTYDAAKEGKNPATAMWTAETERVLRTNIGARSDLHRERSSVLSPFLAVINRGIESHAKLDGWLRFLNYRGVNVKKLQHDLEDTRKKLTVLLERCLANQQEWRQTPSPKTLANYQEAWDQYSKEYTKYHNMIKKNFVKYRDAVASEWQSIVSRTKTAKSKRQK